MSNLLDKLRDANSIPSPPGVALEIIRLNQRDDIDINELADALVRDPAIVAKLMRMANSTSFGRPGQVSDVHQAIMTLGLRSVNLLALSFSLASSSTGEAGDRFDYKRYWTSSAVTTTAAHLLAKKHLPHFADEAFLSSILCDFAQLILAECAGDEYHPVLQRLAKRNESIHEVERELLDGDHAEIGGELLSDWGLPPLICSAIRFHHDPENEANTDRDAVALARVLQLASLVGDIYSGTDITCVLAELQRRGDEYFEMDPSDCQLLLKKTEDSMAEIVEMLGLECNDPTEIANIRIHATEYLVKQSLALNQQIEAVSADSEELKKKNSRLEERATTDALTGLKNRGFFDEWLESECERAAQSRHALGLLILDVDHFKSVNDDHGHQRGDDLLKAIAVAIMNVVRSDDIACRYGGEEIAVIAPKCDHENLVALAERLRKAVGECTVDHNGLSISRTVSIGGSSSAAGADAPVPDMMLEAADTELYRSKSSGRNQVFVASV